MVSQRASTSPFGDQESRQPSPHQQSPQLAPLRRRTTRAAASAHEKQDKKKSSRQRRQIKSDSRSPQHDSSSESVASSSSKSIDSSNITMKIYSDKKLYSIFDHSTKKYIYNSTWDAHKGYLISYSEGKCTTVCDSNGNPVFISCKYRDS